MPDGNENGPADLSGALKGAPSPFRQAPQSFEPAQSALIRWAIKFSGGRIKTSREATIVLAVLAAIAFAVSLYLFFGSENDVNIIIRPAV